MIRKTIYTSFIIIFGGASQHLDAQQNADTVQVKLPIIECGISYSPATFKDGAEKGLVRFLSKNLNMSICTDFAPTVVVDFEVDTLGDLQDVKIAKGGSTCFNQEVIRVFKLMKFEPSIINGKPEKVRLRLPVHILSK